MQLPPFASSAPAAASMADAASRMLDSKTEKPRGEKYEQHWVSDLWKRLTRGRRHADDFAPQYRRRADE